MVPLLRDDESLGVLVFQRAQAGAFDEKEIVLAQSFADQAVIAIENTRLFNETKESLEQQTAISEVLRVISDSPTDVKPVLDTVAARAAQICDASDARIWLAEGEQVRHAAGFGDMLMPVSLGEAMPLRRGTVVGRAILDRKTLHIEDVTAAEDFAEGREMHVRSGAKTFLAVPLLREDRALGLIMLRRKEVRPFTDKQVGLLKTFAHQAAIAIENVRLFNETRESLERQTATAEILKVIAASPSDVQPVFDAIAESARRLLGGAAALVARRAGDKLELAAHTSSGEAADAALRKLFPTTITGRGHMGRALLTAAPAWVGDVDT
jgi:GAF domain-containing protein